MRSSVQRFVQASTPTPVYARVQPYEDLLDPQLRPWRLGATLFSALGTLALAIAAVGLFAVVSYLVTQRLREIGIRLALGGTSTSVARLVAGGALRLVAIGAAVGGIAALALAPLIQSMLFETSMRDIGVLLSITGVLAGTQGGLTLKLADGSVRILSANAPVKLPGLPGGLISKPTLVWEIDASRAGTQPARFTYQTGGMTWWTDYNLTYSEPAVGSCRVDVGAWVTIVNQSGAAFADAKLKLMAGDVQRVQPPQRVYPAAAPMGVAQARAPPAQRWIRARTSAPARRRVATQRGSSVTARGSSAVPCCRAASAWRPTPARSSARATRRSKRAASPPNASRPTRLRARSAPLTSRRARMPTAAPS